MTGRLRVRSGRPSLRFFTWPDLVVPLRSEQLRQRHHPQQRGPRGPWGRVRLHRPQRLPCRSAGDVCRTWRGLRAGYPTVRGHGHWRRARFDAHRRGTSMSDSTSGGVGPAPGSNRAFSPAAALGTNFVSQDTSTWSGKPGALVVTTGKQAPDGSVNAAGSCEHGDRRGRRGQGARLDERREPGGR